MRYYEILQFWINRIYLIQLPAKEVICISIKKKKEWKLSARLGTSIEEEPNISKNIE